MVEHIDLYDLDTVIKVVVNDGRLCFFLRKEKTILPGAEEGNEQQYTCKDNSSGKI